MKIDTTMPRSLPKAFTKATLGLLALVPLTGCVTQARYKEANEAAQYYQRLYQDLESYQGQLEAENTQLKGELELFGGAGTVEAGLNTELDERMRGIEQRLNAFVGGDVAVLSVEGGYGLRLSDAVLFDSGKAELREEGRKLLLKLADEIRQRPFERLWVRGHTDAVPIVKAATKQRFPHGNLHLSVARALEVAAFLSGDAKLPSERIVVAGFGPNDPVAANDSRANQQKNRRVELFVIDPTQEGGQ